MPKRGRPHKKGGSKEVRKLRKVWRDASGKYYKKNRKKILRKAGKKTKKKRRNKR